MKAKVANFLRYLADKISPQSWYTTVEGYPTTFTGTLSSSDSTGFTVDVFENKPEGK